MAKPRSSEAKMRRVNILVDEAMWQRLTEQAIAEDRPIVSIVRQAMTALFQRQEEAERRLCA